jgi:hypothetical protein
MEVTVQFTSTQEADLAPKDLPVNCIRWTLTYQIVSEHGRLVVGSTVPGSPEKRECP